jgi:hypothetical protein
MLVEVIKHIINSFLLLGEPLIRDLKLQFAFYPINYPAFHFAKSITPKVVEVDIQFAALNHFHYNVAETNVKVSVIDSH